MIVLAFTITDDVIAEAQPHQESAATSRVCHNPVLAPRVVERYCVTLCNEKPHKYSSAELAELTERWVAD